MDDRLNTIAKVTVLGAKPKHRMIENTIKNIDVKAISDSATKSYNKVRKNVGEASFVLSDSVKKTSHLFGSNLKRIIATSAVTVATIALAGIVVSANFSLGYLVFVDGNPVGVVTDKVEYQSIVNEIKSEVKTNFDTDISVDVDPTFAMTIVPKNDLTNTTNVKQNIQASSNDLTECFAITIDNANPIYLSDEATAYKALNNFKMQFVASGSPTDATFDRNVKIEKAFVPSTGISKYDDAIVLLNGKKIKNTDHIVSKNDTIGSVARFYNISAQDIITANPALANAAITDFLVIKVPIQKPILSVIVSSVKEYTDYIEFTTETTKDDSLYEGQTQLVSPGQRGEARVKVKLNTQDGKEVSREILSSEVIKPPVSKTERVGTKPLPSPIGTGSYLRPYNGMVSATFHSQSYQNHTGVDFAGPIGSTIVASDNGKVVFAGRKGNYGNLVIIDHNNGYETYYAHCSTITASIGDVVAKGDAIAQIGNTGNSTGPHVHFEIRLAGKPINPFDFV